MKMTKARRVNPFRKTRFVKVRNRPNERQKQNEKKSMNHSERRQMFRIVFLFSKITQVVRLGPHEKGNENER